MKNKKCTSCNTTKNITEFYKRPRGYDGFRGQCKICIQTKSRLRHKKHPEKKKKWFNDYKLYHESRALFFYGAKCQECGETNFAVLQYHHIYGRKKSERRNTLVIKISKAGKQLNDIQLLCANCHFQKHRGKWIIDLETAVAKLSGGDAE